MVYQISPAEAVQRLANDAAVQLLDVRDLWEWETVRVEGAVHIPLGDVGRALYELTSTAPLVVLCHHGVRSHAAAVFLEDNGFENVFNVRGGIEAWAQEIAPGMTRY